ncbi:MAG: hypothetical protein B7Z73_17000, partial [Planctomycetia bacterium 21-64-5]
MVRASVRHGHAVRLAVFRRAGGHFDGLARSLSARRQPVVQRPAQLCPSGDGDLVPVWRDAGARIRGAAD